MEKENLYLQKQKSMKRLGKYASVINLCLTDYNRKSADETMMIKSFRKSDIESTNRKTHSENLENIATLMAEGIGLNVPVVRLMAKHHDIGHTFLGHSGEWWLSEIKKNWGLGYYVHNSLGVRDLVYTHNVVEEIRKALYSVYAANPAQKEDDIEKVCEDLWLIFDGINSHNGELSESTYIPNFAKTKADAEQELMDCHTKEGYDRKLVPATAEASLMRLCDKISYIPYDMIDGLREGMIDQLDEEYIDGLVPILTSDKSMTAEEAVLFINRTVVKQNYHALAHRLQLIFAKDVIQNSTIEKIAMSGEMSKRMHKLRDINNRKIVNYVLMKEDHEVYPKALVELMQECKEIIRKEKILDKLNSADKDIELSRDLREKYKDTPYLKFVEYIARTNKKDFEWTQTMIQAAREQAICDEVEEALDIVKGTKKEKKVKGQEERERRIKIYTKMFRKQVQMMNERGHVCGESNFEQMKEFQKRCVMRTAYPSKEEGLSLEFAAKYLASLSDTEFMDLLKATGKVTNEQYASLTRKYKEIDLEKEYMTHGAWDKISAAQSLAVEKSDFGMQQ